MEKLKVALFNYFILISIRKFYLFIHFNIYLIFLKKKKINKLLVDFDRVNEVSLCMTNTIDLSCYVQKLPELPRNFALN